MKAKKRFLSILLSIVIMLLLIPGMSLTVIASESGTLSNDIYFPPYGLCMGRVNVTETNLSGDGWIYDPATNTVTLDGYNFSSEDDADGIYYEKEGDLTVYLAPGSHNTINVDGFFTHGIFSCYGNIIIDGEGTLEATGFSSGIETEYADLVINGGNVIAAGTFKSDIFIAGNVTINNGTLTTTGKTDGLFAYGNIDINGGTVIAAGKSGDGICAHSLYDYGTYKTYVYDVRIRGGKVAATGTGSAIRASKEVEIIGGEVTANGGNRGICADGGSLTIGSGVTSVVASGNDRALYSSVENGVKNDIAGIGCNDTAGTTDWQEIDVSGQGQDLGSYKKVQFPAPNIYVSDVVLDVSEKTVEVGELFALTASITPGIAADKTVKWSVNNGHAALFLDEACTQFVGMDPTSARTVYVKGIWPGTAAIDVTTNDGGKTASCNVTVNSVHNHDNIVYQPWRNTDSLPTSGSYFLTGNVLVSTQTTVSDTLNLCLNGYDIIMNNSTDVFVVPTGTEMHLCDCDSYGRTNYVKYFGRGDTIYAESEIPPVSAGTYTAKIIRTNMNEGGSVTASVDYEIKKADLVTTDKEKSVPAAVAANNCIYSGQEMQLVTVIGDAIGGTMNYALGEKATSPADDLYSTAIPSGTEVGTYYVWYKVGGDDNHFDTEPRCVAVTIYDQNTLFYNGKDQELVKAGTVEGGTFFYTLGSDDVTAPAETAVWSEEIPTGKEVAEYFVWYKVNGDDNHNDAEPKCVKVAIVPDGQVDGFKEMLKELPEKEEVTSDDKNLVVGLRTIYDALSEKQKSLISEEELMKLTAAEAKIAEIDEATVERFTSTVNAVPGNKAGQGKALFDAATEIKEQMTEAQLALVPQEILDLYEEELAAFAKGRVFRSGSAYYRVLSNGDVTYLYPADRSLENATVPNQVKKGKFFFKVIKVSNNAFRNCNKLKSVIISENIYVLGERIFARTDNLASVRIMGTEFRSGKVANAFYRAGNIKLTVPGSKVAEYEELFRTEGKLSDASTVIAA